MNAAPPEQTQIEVPKPRRRAFIRKTPAEHVLGVLWTLVWHAAFRWSPPFMRWWRNTLLNIFGAKVHRTAYVAPSVRIDFPWNLRIGAESTVCHNSILNCMGEIKIGDRTRVSQYGHICAGTHDYNERDMRIIRSPITIGDDVWIAADAFVGPGVTIGDGCMLAARSSAFGNLPAGQICVGEPAEPRKARFA